jgi:hypothetical protein
MNEETREGKEKNGHLRIGAPSVHSMYRPSLPQGIKESKINDLCGFNGSSVQRAMTLQQQERSA